MACKRRFLFAGGSSVVVVALATIIGRPALAQGSGVLASVCDSNIASLELLKADPLLSSFFEQTCGRTVEQAIAQRPAVSAPIAAPPIPTDTNVFRGPTQVRPSAPMVIEKGLISPPQSRPIDPQTANAAEPPTTEPAAPGSRVFTGFVIRGATAVSANDLQQALAPFLGASIDLRNLDQVTQVVNTLYRERGWLARSTLPPQDLTDGRLIIQIRESTFSGVSIEDPSGALRNTQVPQRLIESAQPVDKAVSLKALEDANARLSDLAGVKTQLNVIRGREDGETGAVLRVEPTDPIELTVGVDNSGSRSTGRERAHARLTLNNPTERGDVLVGQGLVTEGIRYAQVQYSLPFNEWGWRAGAQTSSMQYELISSNFSGADMRGPTSNVGLFLAIPLHRSLSSNVTLQTMFDDNRYRNEASGQLVSKYQSQILSIGLEGNSADNLLGGGDNSWSLTWSRGELDLSDSPSAHQLADSMTTNTAGYFSKARLAAMRRQFVDPSNTLLMTLQGQWADRNLDGSEKFYLGGARGVRAYPTNEAGGAFGGLASLEWQHRWNSIFHRWTLTGFYDHGQIRINKRNDFSGAPTLNRYELSGLGVWLGTETDWGFAKSNIRLTWARRLGENPGRSGLGLDADGTRTLNQIRLDANLRY